MIVIGVDPGAAHTGIVVRRATSPIDVGELLSGTTIHRTELDLGRVLELRNLAMPAEPYRNDVLDHLDALTCADGVDWTRADLIAVEGVHPPTGFSSGRRAALNPAAIIGTGVMLGVILGHSWPCPVVIVPPGGNGYGLPLGRYPGQLATTGKGQDRWRHQRSAYDVAIAGHQLHHRQAAARVANREAIR